MAKKHANVDFINATPFDDLFGGAENAPSEEEIDFIKNAEGSEKNISVNDLIEHKHHSFKVLDDEAMDHLKESIETNGIIYPLLVRKSDDKYEILSGHRRLHAAKAIGLKEVRCKIMDVDDATSDIIMVDTNLHREEILPSEKARSYDIRIKAMQEKGLLSSAEGERPYEELLAENINSSRVNVYRYRKLIQLIPELLNLVDDKYLAVNTGAKLSALSKEAQKNVFDALGETRNALTMEKADILLKEPELTKERVLEILDDRKPRRAYKTAAVKEKNFFSAYPGAIRSLPANEKEAFIRDCIKEYINTHEDWKGNPLS